MRFSSRFLPAVRRPRGHAFGPLGIAVLLLLPGATTASAQSAAGRIEGRVLTEEGGAPLADVRVRVATTAHETVTDADGAFRIDGVPPGEQVLIFQRFGRETVRRTVRVAAGDDVAVDVRMSEAAVAADEIVVSAERALGLNSESTAGTRLGLAIREVPATIDVISQADAQRRGLRNVTDAYNAAPGVTAGNIPGSPATISMRGFTFDAISYLIDGVRVTNSGFMSRNWDTWSYERIEILKGPASVLYGTGALAGSINLVPKRASLDGNHGEALLSGGSFGSYRVGLGANRALGEKVAVRGHAAYSRSDGYVDQTSSETLALAASVRLQPLEPLRVDVALDYARDDFGTAYFGQPLIGTATARSPSDIVSTQSDLVVDEALRERNYNVTDGLMDSEAYRLRTRARYELSDAWTIINELSFYSADRRWANSEDFVYDGNTGLLDRFTTKIFHDHEFWLERAFLSYDSGPRALRHRMGLGVEYGKTAFFTPRRFGATTAVDPFAPARGAFPEDTPANFGTRVDFDTDITEAAVFAEGAVDVAERLHLVGGLRYDEIDVERTVDDLNADVATTFDRTFDAISWRVGAVVDVHRSSQLFAQYSSAIVPVSSLLTLSQSRAAFDLSRGTGVEAGLKTLLWDDRLALTASAYRITQDDILTRDPNDFALTVQGGEKSSTGVELAFVAELTERLRVDGNLTYLDARFDELLGGGVDLAGNTPSNVPERTFNGNASYTFGRFPLTIGLSMTSVGDFFTDDANTIHVAGRDVWGAHVSYDTAIGTLTVRGRNLADHLYVNWSGYSPTMVYLGEPRSFDITWTTRF